jgi:hypothetical protein
VNRKNGGSDASVLFACFVYGVTKRVDMIDERVFPTLKKIDREEPAPGTNARR